MSANALCLNCTETINGKFCINCGQKSDTHRITLKHFLFHDILHGVWHMEKAIFFTTKEVVTRPGFAALDYISGKRIKYYNIFSLIVLILGFNLFLYHYYNYLMLTIRGVSDVDDSTNSALLQFATKYEKPLMLLLIPMMAICSFIAFNKRKFNFAEHLIISGYVFVGYLLITTAGVILCFFNLFDQNFIEDIVTYVERVITVLYIIFCYYQVTKLDYSKVKFGIRMLLFSFIFVLQVFLVLVIMSVFTLKK